MGAEKKQGSSRFICVVQHGDVVFVGNVQIGIVKYKPAQMQMMIDAPVAPVVTLGEVDPHWVSAPRAGSRPDEHPLDICPPQRAGYARYAAFLGHKDGVTIGPIHIDIIRRNMRRMDLFIDAPTRPIVMVRDGAVRVGKHHPIPADMPLRHHQSA